MVLGLRTKNRKSPTVHLDYLIHIQEVKPWPPSQSLRTLRSVLIQWEHGERSSGSTNPVVPFLGSGIADGKIEFNESFKLPVTLLREVSTKGGDGDTFQKSCIEFNLYELRRDKTVKGQLLGTAIVDLASFGGVKDTLSIHIPINSKRSLTNTAQPVLVLNIQSTEKGRTRSSSKDSLSKEVSMERNGGESVSALMSEEYAEEAEIGSITDDDVSSHSSLAVSSPAFESNGGLSSNSEENGSQAMKDSSGEGYDQHHLTSNQGALKFDAKPVNELHEVSGEMLNTNMRSKDCDILVQDEEDDDGGSGTSSNALQGSKGNKLNGSLAVVTSPDRLVDEMLNYAISVEPQINQEDSDRVWSSSTKHMDEGATTDINNGPAMDIGRKEHQENGRGAEIIHEGQHSIEDEPCNKLTRDETTKHVSLAGGALPVSGEDLGLKSNMLNGDRLKHVKSVRSLGDSGRSNGSIGNGKLGEAQNGPQNERKETKVYANEKRNIIKSDGRIQQLEHRIKNLEGELRESAAVEIGLYSVVAEHGSSINKVHAPARRLSRLYLHACKDSFQSRMASAARSAVSGLVLVAKACGNDVPRLTFWLSNVVVLRAIISQASAKQQLPRSAGHLLEKPGGGKGKHKKSSPLKWKEPSPSKETKGALCESFEDWDDPHTFTSALERIEAWIYSRIIESLWWQTLTPHMQSTAAKAIHTGLASGAHKTYQRTSSSGDQDQVNVSLELWKKAFKDACERLCPVRAAGHDCGCLPVLARMIMEQCVARLDVAMFNAILRDSDDEIPTDPVSDPISDAKVLPIPAGRASFGAGAQLKNAIGNWSRWLSDLFGIDDGDSHEDKNDDIDDNSDDERKNYDMSFKSFHLLNALSDLMMLPKDMLLSRSIRKEVCPTFGTPLIKRLLNNFVPDEFCPDPIPRVVLEALDIEDPPEGMESSVTNFPCSAAPVVYLAPSAASVAGIIGDVRNQSQLRRSGSSVLKKSYTSDDELDELDSPLTAIIDSFQGSPATKPSWISKDHGSRNTIRYGLLREVWMNSE
ncbi:Myosin-H heavy chain like [Actinidia chinensis var. chinensis]|uniref:Myosin-H heavy chain like n=1 Tax=Actinidia chinensis var. chinensis TaxID=1590841 RepID=A0A2R6P936_ACTCC|nr:Myosin-H heavy chain like [Actinidia chinensis var. chinensis]